MYSVEEDEAGTKCSGVLDGLFDVYYTIGKGQFAKVKLGFNRESKKWCAIKLMKDISSLDKLGQFMNEVRLLSQCSSPPIVRLQFISIFGTFINRQGFKKTVCYHVTEYAKNGELFDLIKEIGGLSEKMARTLFLQLLNGLDYLHSIKISHRDIKPENLLLDEQMNLLIADFGSAALCRTEDNKEIEFDSAVIVGSLEYNAPEINMDKNYFGAKADLFSAGVCLFFMVTGCSPFREASHEDPQFKLLSAHEHTCYWNSYGIKNYSGEFQDLFEHIAERNVGKRFGFSDICAHPWCRMEVFEPVEFSHLMKTLIEPYTKRRTRELEEKLAYQKYKQKLGVGMQVPISAEALACEKAIQLDPNFASWAEECDQLNMELSIRQQDCNIKHQESLSDDQICSGSCSDRSLHEIEEEFK